jgi:hypothetical protein
MNARLLRPLATGFNPRSIAGLALWLDASDTASVTLVSGAVSQWNDKSGNSRNATQTSANDRPTTTTINGRQGIVFNGTSARLSISAPWGAAITLFYVTTPSTVNDSYLFASDGLGGSPGMLSRYINAGARRDFEWWNANGSDRVIVATSSPGLNVLSFTNQDGGAFFGFVNGTQTATKGTVAATTAGRALAAIGSAGSVAFSNATIGEFLIYNRVLSTSERRRVESALGRKWGIAVA